MKELIDKSKKLTTLLQELEAVTEVEKDFTDIDSW